MAGTERIASLLWPRAKLLLFTQHKACGGRGGAPEKPWDLRIIPGARG